MKKIAIVFLVFLVSNTFFGQDEDMVRENQKSLASSKNYTWDANKKLSEDNFIAAEADYRVAISKSKENAAAPYNLGNAYYNTESYSEAFGRFKQAGENAAAKPEKHNAYHNMGNVFMKRKEYAKAVEAYKEALRNDPTDEETRYNLALAKELLKKDEENQDKNNDDKDEQDKDDKKDEQDKDGDNKEDENKDKKDEGDKGDEEDKGDQKEDENKEGDGDDKKEQNKKPEQGDNEKEQPQPRPDQLSKQQVENLLRAMQNAEKQVQEKIDAKKVQGVKIKTEKDW